MKINTPLLNIEITYSNPASRIKEVVAECRRIAHASEPSIETVQKMLGYFADQYERDPLVRKAVSLIKDHPDSPLDFLELEYLNQGAIPPWLQKATV